MTLALLADFKDVAARLPGSTWMTAGGFTFIAFLAGIAFATGVMRQIVNMVSIGVGVSVAWWVFRHRVDVFGNSASSMGVDRLLIFSAGLGVIGYGVARVLAKVLSGFGLFKLAGVAGWQGMLLSFVPSAFLIWISTMVVRFLGNLYGMESASRFAQEGSKFQGHFGEIFNEARRMIDKSMFGNVLNNVDPISIQRTGNLARLLIVWPEKRIWPQLAADPETRKVFSHPKVALLGHDKDVRACIEKKDYPGLLQLPQVESTASLPDLENVLTSAGMEAAMDRIIYGRSGK
jgi:hypothetical protein